MIRLAVKKFDDKKYFVYKEDKNGDEESGWIGFSVLRVSVSDLIGGCHAKHEFSPSENCDPSEKIKAGFCRIDMISSLSASRYEVGNIITFDGMPNLENHFIEYIRENELIRQVMEITAEMGTGKSLIENGNKIKEAVRYCTNSECLNND